MTPGASPDHPCNKISKKENAVFLMNGMEEGKYNEEREESRIMDKDMEAMRTVMRLAHLYSQKSHFQHILDWLHHLRQH